MDTELQNLRSMLLTTSANILLFENKNLQESAKVLMPGKYLEDEAKKNLLRLKQDKISDVDFQDCLILELLTWFKTFFSWFDCAKCELCSTNMKLSGMVSPLPIEERYGPLRVEGYSCEKCGSTSRFPRYSHPEPLLTTRKGRCMEWACVFTLFCRTLGFEARYVWDVTDHVWTEIFSNSQNRWVHADCCENKLDTPLMYEAGWNKKLSYIYAISKDEVVDVTWRYSNKHSDVVNRRMSYDEDRLAECLYILSYKLQKNESIEKKKILEARRVKEIVEFFSTNKHIKEGEDEGRISGSLDWRLSRREIESTTSKDSFTFVPSSEEVLNKVMEIKYNPANNFYIRSSSDAPIESFEKLVYSYKNIFRKHESDWNMVYLCRTENSSGSDKGEIEWNFDWSSTNLEFQSAFIVLQHEVFENGCIEWMVSSDNTEIKADNITLNLVSSDFENSVKGFKISVSLSGGKGRTCWQHAQLLRQKDDADTWPFFVKINFKE